MEEEPQQGVFLRGSREEHGSQWEASTGPQEDPMVRERPVHRVKATGRLSQGGADTTALANPTPSLFSKGGSCYQLHNET